MTETKYQPIIWDIETTGVNPLAQAWHNGTDFGARITAVGFSYAWDWNDVGSWEDADIHVDSYWDSDEYNLLRVVEDRLQQLVAESREYYDREPFLVGWNSRRFDHPYIGARYARKRLEGSLFVSDLKRLDMMVAAGKRDERVSRYPSEDDYAEMLGFEVYDELTGAEMPEAWDNGEWDKIETHVEADVDMANKIFIKERETFMSEFVEHYSLEENPQYGPEVEY